MIGSVSEDCGSGNPHPIADSIGRVQSRDGTLAAPALESAA